MTANQPLILALPKGRILKAITPILKRAGIELEDDFFNESSRRLQFHTNQADLEVIRVRSFDTATFLAFGAAHLAIAGSDVLMEFDHPEIYAPVDLNVGQENPQHWSHLRIATKYPNVTRRHFAARGVQAECIKLNGAMELAPGLGLCRRIVDLVETGSTLKANGLVEVEQIAAVSARLAVNRAALKTRPGAVKDLVDRIGEAALAA